ASGKALKLGGNVVELAAEVLARMGGRVAQRLAIWRALRFMRRFGFRLLENDTVEPFAQGHPRPAGRLLGGFAGVVANTLNTPRNSRFHAQSRSNGPGLFPVPERAATRSPGAGNPHVKVNGFGKLSVNPRLSGRRLLSEPSYAMHARQLRI